MTPRMREVLNRLKNPKRSGDGYQANCPAHDDRHPSLRVSEGEGGRVLLYCHAKCSIEQIVAALGLTMADLMPAKAEKSKTNKVQSFKTEVSLINWVAQYARAEHKNTWVYHSAVGSEFMRIARFEGPKGKQFRPFWRAQNGWQLGDPPGKLPIFNLPDVVAADQVAVFEGEKCAEIGRDIGLVTTTSAHGAQSAHKSDWAPLSGKRVLIFPDHGIAGDDYSNSVISSLKQIDPPPESVRVIRLPGLGDGDDVEQFIQNKSLDAAKAEIEKLISEAPLVGLAASSNFYDKPPSDIWPKPLENAAMHGLAGEFVRLIEPHSEADPAALLAQFLLGFGNVVGRSAHQVVESDCHYSNIFVVIVGRTAKGRKGTSLGHVTRLLELIDNTWVDRYASNLASGEGLVFAVRDPSVSPGSGKGKGAIDLGVSDKRLLVVESEFASALRVCQRDGNTLSAMVRQAWDRGDLGNMSKNSPLRATGAHISIIGHVTRDEVLRLIKRTELANGFCNRFLWVCAKRSKMLPEGGRPAQAQLRELLKKLKSVVEFAKAAGELRRDPIAKKLWAEVYPQLSEGHSGMYGAATSRAEAQVVRLSCIYALLDCSAVIKSEHLLAALAVWHYCEASAKYTFGNALGNPTADSILDLLRERPSGVTRTEIRDHFKRHNGGEVQIALELLMAENLAYCVKVPTGGRHIERWFLKSA